MRLSIATKIFIAFAAVIVVFTVVLMFGIYRTQTTYQQIRTVNQTVVPLSLLLSDVQTDLKSFSLVLNERDPLVLRRTLQVTRLGPSMPDRLRSKMERAEAVARTADALGAEQRTLDDARADIASLRKRIDDFAAESRDFADLVLAGPDSADEAVALKQTELRDEARALDEQLTTIRSDLQASTDRGLARAKQVEKSSLYALSLSSVVALAIAIGLLIAVLMTIRRLTALTEATKRIGEGDYRPMDDVAQPAVARDEIEELRGEFNAMARRLQERDVALREQHAKLLKSERLATIGRMTSLITHELRNPLSSINLNTEMLMESLAEEGAVRDDSDVMPVLETIINEVDRLRDITEEYLVYARLPSPKLDHEHLEDVLQNLVDFHASEWSGRDVDVTLSIEDELPAAVDANQMRQAFLNLVRNAVEASPAGASVQIIARRSGTDARVQVIDEGSGISAEAQARIFEPFFTTKTRGTGLGLAMTQQIVEEHQGRLEVGTTPGGGTTFTITVPLANAS